MTEITDRITQMLQLLTEISRLEEELNAISLRDVHALDEQRRKIERLQAAIAHYHKQGQDALE